MSDEQIIEKLDIKNLPKEVQDETLASINRAVELRVMGLVDDLMSDEQRAELRLKTADDPKSIWKWLSKEVTDVDKMYDAALVDYLDEKTKKKTGL